MQINRIHCDLSKEYLMKGLNIIQTDFNNSKHATAFLSLMSAYATDIMGGGDDLPEEVKRRLIHELQKRNDVVSIMAYSQEEAVGMAIAFEGFSTFYARPLLNIHDFVVKEDCRGKGIVHAMLTEMEKIAKRRNCCKLTLEVLEGNTRAQKVYKEFGFAGYELDDKMGKALFWQKKLVQ